MLNKLFVTYPFSSQFLARLAGFRYQVETDYGWWPEGTDERSITQLFVLMGQRV
jgi:hypothetical protein